MSVLVFKDGEVINVLRVIENEDGSYSPQSSKTITPPRRVNEKDPSAQVKIFKKMAEDIKMASKMDILKSQMKDLASKRQHHHLLGNDRHQPCVPKLNHHGHAAAAANAESRLSALTRRRESMRCSTYKLLNDKAK